MKDVGGTGRPRASAAGSPRARAAALDYRHVSFGTELEATWRGRTLRYAAGDQRCRPGADEPLLPCCCSCPRRRRARSTGVPRTGGVEQPGERLAGRGERFAAGARHRAEQASIDTTSSVQYGHAGDTAAAVLVAEVDSRRPGYRAAPCGGQCRPRR